MPRIPGMGSEILANHPMKCFYGGTYPTIHRILRQSLGIQALGRHGREPVGMRNSARQGRSTRHLEKQPCLKETNRYNCAAMEVLILGFCFHLLALLADHRFGFSVVNLVLYAWIKKTSLIDRSSRQCCGLLHLSDPIMSFRWSKATTRLSFPFNV